MNILEITVFKLLIYSGIACGRTGNGNVIYKGEDYCLKKCGGIPPSYAFAYFILLTRNDLSYEIRKISLFWLFVKKN